MYLVAVVVAVTIKEESEQKQKLSGSFPLFLFGNAFTISNFSRLPAHSWHVAAS
jgi:hypothetical protein